MTLGLPGRRAPLWPVAITRMAMGALWLWALRWKLPPDFEPGSERGLREWLELEVEHAAIGWYGDLVDSVVLPNFELFAWALFATELLVGLSLLTGTLTRLGSLMGLVMSINLLVGLLDVPGEWPWSYVMMALLHGTILVTAAGRVWGVDAWLRPTLDPSHRARRFT